MHTFNGDTIQVLDSLEHVRKRPNMYIGSTNSQGLHNLVWIIVDQAINEHWAGFCDRIAVSLNKDGSVTVNDNGRGVPVDRQGSGISASRMIYTMLCVGHKHGAASVVNALSAWMEVGISRDGNIYRDRFENGGNPVVDLVDGLLPAADKSKGSGTKVSFLPDAAIFEAIEFKPEVIKKRLKELAFLNKGLMIVFTDYNSGEVVEFCEKDGIVGFIRELNKAKDTIHKEVVYLASKSGDIEVEIAFQFTKDFDETIFAFCNNIYITEGGTNISGFKASLTRVINHYAREHSSLEDKDENLDVRDVCNGITAIVLIKHPYPHYDSDARKEVDEICSAESLKFFDHNPETLKAVIENALKSFKLHKVE